MTPVVSGLTLTADGRYLLAAGDPGAVVVDVARAEQGRGDAVVGTLSTPVSANGRTGAGAIEVASSPDGGYAFVSLEASDELAVFNLRAAIARRLRTSGFIGMVPVGGAPVGLAISPNGRLLYATSEQARGATAVGPQGAGGPGTLSVIDLARAERQPATSVVATVEAGCSPVRVAASPDGQTVWVTARGSDALLGFSAPRLLGDPRRALIAQVPVGAAPVGLALFDHGARIAIADSNRFRAAGAVAELSFVDTANALAGRPALLGSAPAGLFPREIAVEPNGRVLLVTNYDSHQLEAVRPPEPGPHQSPRPPGARSVSTCLDYYQRGGAATVAFSGARSDAVCRAFVLQPPAGGRWDHTPSAASRGASEVCDLTHHGSDITVRDSFHSNLGLRLCSQFLREGWRETRRGRAAALRYRQLRQIFNSPRHTGP